MGYCIFWALYIFSFVYWNVYLFVFSVKLLWNNVSCANVKALHKSTWTESTMSCTVTYSHTVDVLKLDVSERDEAVIFVVFLWQIQRLRGFAPLGVIETHWTRKINEDLHTLWGLSWEQTTQMITFISEIA